MAEILVGSDGRCRCSCAHTCACKPGNVGSGWRCTEEELIAAGHTPVRFDIEKGKKYLTDLLKSLKESRKRWCSNCVDDAEEMWTEYPEFIEAEINSIENLLGLPCSKLMVISAQYGINNIYKDVASIIQEKVDVDSIDLLVDNRYLGGDPVPGVKKELIVKYTLNGETVTIVTPENEKLIIA